MEDKKTTLIAKMKQERDWSLNYHKLMLDHDPDMLSRWDELYSAGKFKGRRLSSRDKEMIDLGLSIAQRWATGLQIHIKRAMDLGITEAELAEIFSHVAMSTGIPCMIFAADVYMEMKKNDFGYTFPQYEDDL